MEGQGCRFGSGAGAGRFLISLEDLDSVTEDERLDLAGNSNGEEENEQNEDGLLAHWQDIGRRHQVDVSRDMAEPIQQMTTNNQSQDREMVPFMSIAHKKQADELLYEKRQYKKAKWACVTQFESRYEQSICLGFMKLMKYICQQNSSGLFLGMTVPIVTIVHTNQTRTELQPEVTVAYYLPAQFQDQAPQPFDAEIAIEEWPAHIIYTRPFNGTTNEELILQEINQLAEHLDSPELFLQDTFIVAGYNNPAAPSRHNEIWFIHRP
ncbi:heme-binding protein soul3 [Heterodontus francisci]|uniref:heme-binding protein soul3 n=1 Tax=Heterodontus francisci TaxID=7792 RepID=UPI00355C302B